MTTTKLILVSSALMLAGAFPVLAQNETQSSSYRASDDFGARAGDWEFTLGGGGASNTDMDSSGGGVSASAGYYFSDTLELSVRQTTNYSNGAGDAQYDGSTFVALDHHFGSGRLRPFVGVNVGAVYGENTSDSWAAGLEGGLKFYVQPRTFLFALVNYAWTFEDASDADDTFSDGGLLWTVGVGFNL